MKWIFLFFAFIIYTSHLTGQVKEKAIHYKTAETTLSENQKTDIQNWFKKYRDHISSITIEGYADSIGTVSYTHLTLPTTPYV